LARSGTVTRLPAGDSFRPDHARALPAAMPELKAAGGQAR